MKILTHQNALLRWGITLTFTAFLAVLLLQSSGDPAVGPAAPPGDPTPARELELTLGHIFGFGGLTLLWWWALHSHLSTTQAIIGALAFSLAFGVFTEYMQISVPDRNASWWDIFTNTAAALGVAIVLLWWHRSPAIQR